VAEANLPDLSTVATHVYTPIKPWQTRILCLQPGTFTDPLVARLVIADLIYAEGVVLHETYENVHYSALSYFWGFPVRSHSMTINGYRFPIIATLFVALKRLRDPLNPTYLWIDAICMYPDRYRTKCCRNLRFEPQFGYGQ